MREVISGTHNLIRRLSVCKVKWNFISSEIKLALNEKQRLAGLLMLSRALSVRLIILNMIYIRFLAFDLCNDWKVKNVGPFPYS